jgi:hypothetical protein
MIKNNLTRETRAVHAVSAAQLWNSTSNIIESRATPACSRSHVLKRPRCIHVCHAAADIAQITPIALSRPSIYHVLARE